MAYQVFLLEELDVDNWIELDVEDIDFSTIYSVADVKDISTRKDNITKQIAFKGSKVNNQAFGNLFHQNMISDFNFDNRLFFNYNPLRTVECLIYEDSVLLLKGSLRVLEIDVDKDNNILYQTVVTGQFIEIRDILIEKKLTDLDFSDLRHHYKWDTIQDSWDIRTERYDDATSGYTFSSFANGSGYMYPYIDYGYIYKQVAANGDLNSINGLNFKPAVFVREYFNRIFNQPELAGFTYEIKGDNTFINKFDSLIIPNADEKMRYKFVGFNLKFSKPLVQIENQVGSSFEGMRDGKKLISLNNLPTLPPDTIASMISNLAPNYRVFNIDRTFTSDAKAAVTFSSLKNPYNFPLTVIVSVMERDKANDENPFGDWTAVNEKSFILPTYDLITYGVVLNKIVVVDINEREWDESKQVGLMVTIHSDIDIQGATIGNDGPRICLWDIFVAELQFPKDTLTPFTVDVLLNSELDIIVPTAPDNINQMDFLKSVISQFNLYVYNEKQRPKHFIFQRYDDYYALSQTNLLSSTALDWTKKIDYTSGLKIKSNVQIPKKYLFTYKSDSDYINTNYQKVYNEPYGTFKFNDGYGLTDSKNVELIFSPSPLVQYASTNKVHPAIYAVESNNKKPVKSNIRMMYYNGLKKGAEYTIGLDERINITGYTVNTIVTGLTSYPQVGNYYLQSGIGSMVPVDDLDWGVPAQLYFEFTPAHLSATTAFSNYYIGQVTDLTNPNVTYIDADVYLNEIDITNINLRTPVFVDLGELGHSYFKVLNVEYENNKTTSRVSLQKIVI